MMVRLEDTRTVELKGNMNQREENIKKLDSIRV